MASAYTYRSVILAVVLLLVGGGTFAVLGISTEQRCGRYLVHCPNPDAPASTSTTLFPVNLTLTFRPPGSQVTLNAATVLHSLPARSSPRVSDTIRAGSSVKYDCTTVDGNWVRVIYRTVSGWVPKDNIHEDIVPIPCTNP
jgi:hypothetical protein